MLDPHVLHVTLHLSCSISVKALFVYQNWKLEITASINVMKCCFIMNGAVQISVPSSLTKCPKIIRPRYDSCAIISMQSITGRSSLQVSTYPTVLNVAFVSWNWSNIKNPVTSFFIFVFVLPGNGILIFSELVKSSY